MTERHPAPVRRAARLAAAGFVALTAGSAGAAEIELGLGRDDVLDRWRGSGTAFGVEVRSRPLAALGPVAFGFGGAAEIDDGGDAWAGLGPVAYLPLDRNWRLDASLMAGVYTFHDGHDLGLPLEFRSRLGVSRRISGRWRAGLALEHKSNAGAGDRNPGIETLFLTLSRSY